VAARAHPGPGRPALARPPAVRLDARKVVATGTALWFVAFVALLPFWTWLGEHHHRVWLWTCLAGGVLGVLGYLLMAKHRREGRTG
jgi:hypothetical protein